MSIRERLAHLMGGGPVTREQADREARTEAARRRAIASRMRGEQARAELVRVTSRVEALRTSAARSGRRMVR